MAMQSSAEQPIPVRGVSEAVAGWISRLGAIWVEGQLAQINKRPGSQMVYLVLRDPSADVSMQVTTFRRVFDTVVPPLTEGARVVIYGKPDFYVPRSSFSIRAEEIRQVGLGELLARLEMLKAKLGAEGLFDPRRKKPLPFLPGCVGLITGRASAAERDVLENARRRWPGVQFRVVNTDVQGPKAVPQILPALAQLDADAEVDVIIIARGGGSVEDLLPFSDEALIRAVAECETPVVSAIGHEPDSPILDLVADFRASTPTDAAKRVVPDVAEEMDRVSELRRGAWRSVARILEREAMGLAAFRQRPVLASPYSMIDGRRNDLEELIRRARACVGHRLDRASDDLGHTLARVRALSPMATLERGYSIVLGPSGHAVRAASEVGEGDALDIRLASGRLGAAVTAVDAAETTT
ncbi:MAG: exodeoxyribonuclease VII large subunit [Catenulispora sp. 13_1_20CM_3_70_7]|nr:exodeoxyribonuclease VII large subunit [Catenulisporales bacterium]OLE20930.1 MAG: exodeoxyribonuclease VII large subunit [Catenulispora sp. 13_1_20CM_3_70_7]